MRLKPEGKGRDWVNPDAEEEEETNVTVEEGG